MRSSKKYTYRFSRYGEMRDRIKAKEEAKLTETEAKRNVKKL